MYISPSPLMNATEQIKESLMQIFDREITEKCLCYHTRDHLQGVQRRASQIFKVVSPFLKSIENPSRLEHLLDFCAITHDLIQVFIPHTEANITRRREPGISELSTIQVVLDQIQKFDSQQDRDSFTACDLYIIREAILTTICEYDPIEQAIFQPMLYETDRPISYVSRILALADIGTLGIEGIEAYNSEGRLLFLEENPDVRSILKQQQLSNICLENPELAENIRQRLLKRTQFQVNLAKSRLVRCPQELAAFPTGAIPELTHKVFQHLTPQIIQEIEATTPIAEDIALETLISFFKFDSEFVKSS
jgi:hypothetical protein